MIQEKNKFPHTETSLEKLMDFKPDREELIRGMLYDGDHLIVCGDRKIGKSFILMNLAQSLTIGGTWMGSKVIRSDVLYVNSHIRERVFHRRDRAIYTAIGAYAHKTTNYITSYPVKTITPDNFLQMILMTAKRMNYTMAKGRRHLVIIVDSIDGIGFRSLRDFLEKYAETFDGNAPSLIVGTSEFQCEAHLRSSVVFLEKYWPNRTYNGVIANFLLKSFPMKETLLGKFTYPLFNWKPIEIEL